MRYQYLDILRWLCILLMILFHLNYSLVNIFELDFLNFSESFWYVLWRVSALWFMMISGGSFYLASQKYSAAQLQKKYLKYAWVLAVIAIGITLVTYVFAREQLILFGILHLFAVSFFLLPFMVRFRYWVFISLVVVLVIWLLFDTQTELRYLFPLWFYSSDFRSADYYPLMPYFWYVLAWYVLAQMLEKYNLMQVFALNRKLIFPEKILSWLGKRSLIIYIIHQPIIIAALWSILTFM